MENNDKVIIDRVKLEELESAKYQEVALLEHKIYSEVLQLFVEGRIEVRGQKVFIKR